MKQVSYIGAESDTIVINRTTDLYPLIDWAQSRMIDCQENAKGSDKDKWQRSIDYCSKLMQQIEKDDMGSFDDVENIEY